MGSRVGACLTVLLTLLWTAPASAFDMQMGVGMRAGLASFWRSADNVDVDNPDAGGGYGAQVYALWRPFHEFAVGLNADLSGTSHRGDLVGTSTPSLGIMLRTNDVLFENWSFVVWSNFQFGTATIGAATPMQTSMGPQTLPNAADVLGVVVGLQALYRFQVGPTQLFLELGPYIQLNYLEEDGAAEAPEVQAVGFGGGVVLQANFDVTF